MKSITVKVTDDAYRDARIWAAANGTSISAIVQHCIQHLPNQKSTVISTFELVKRRKEALAKLASTPRQSLASATSPAANRV
jgi:hypothetical protein